MNQLQIPKIELKPYLEYKQQRQACCLYAPSVLVCYDQQLKLPVPLKNVTYNIRVMKGLTCVKNEQVYSTFDRDQPVDLEYLFVINKNAAVTKMTVELIQSIDSILLKFQKYLIISSCCIQSKQKI